MEGYHKALTEGTFAVGFGRRSLRSIGVDYGLVVCIVLGIEDNKGRVVMEAMRYSVDGIGFAGWMAALPPDFVPKVSDRGPMEAP